MKTKNENTRLNPALPKIKVKIEEGEAPQPEYEFTKPFHIGRDESCEVQLLSHHVSRFHLEVYYQQNHWWLRDLQSSNGTFVNGEKIQELPLVQTTRVELGIKGVVLWLEVPPPEKAEITSLQQDGSMTQYMRKYTTSGDGETVGEHTKMIRRVIQTVQKKQQRKYYIIIAIFIFLCLLSGSYAIYRHLDYKKNRELATSIFYSMKAMELRLAQIELAISKSSGSEILEQIQSDQLEIAQKEENYDKLIKSLGIYKKNMTAEDQIIFKIARIFGECELNMPPGFVTEVKNYIQKWKSTNRYTKAIARAQEKSLADPIVTEMLKQRLPAQFFYLALQESDFDANKCGPETKYGFAKGIWQFIPTTAQQYGLKLGPLYDYREPDVNDERYDFEKSTQAAARHIRDIYATSAQASGLLVIASYNWGAGNVTELIRQLPKNPRERNFWKLLERFQSQIPDETYNYVFYIISAAVIGENPRLFGFEFDNPLASALKK